MKTIRAQYVGRLKGVVHSFHGTKYGFNKAKNNGILEIPEKLFFLLLKRYRGLYVPVVEEVEEDLEINNEEPKPASPEEIAAEVIVDPISPILTVIDVDKKVEPIEKAKEEQKEKDKKDKHPMCTKCARTFKNYAGRMAHERTCKGKVA